MFKLWLLSAWPTLCINKCLYNQSITIIDKLNIFSYHSQPASKKNMKIEKFSCSICGCQVSQKNNLERHKRAVHEGFRYPCRICDYEATTQGSLARHKRAVHDEVKYPCRQCKQNFTAKGSLIRHLREVHEGVKRTDMQSVNETWFFIRIFRKIDFSSVFSKKFFLIFASLA